ncbi:MAG TPA: serine/threonine-protein kinase [Kofleriaceae bacterium]
MVARAGFVAGSTDTGARPRREDGRRQGRYVLGELLGRGGMAEVFAGNSMGAHGFQKPVAIKRLLPELANDEVFVERLIGEAKLLVGMAHGNIVSVLDLARDGDDVFIVMEFVDGPSLRQLMKARGSRGVPIGVTTYVLQAAAAGLEFAHNRPGGAIIHADISPSNILLTTSGEVRVADFGIARREGGVAGVVEGKWAYMAPEQARGEALTPRSDVFALGVVLYELLCGEHPLGRQVTAGERELEPKRIVPPRVVRPQIPPGLDAICMKMLSYEPRDRYARMQQVIDALVDERFANGYRDGANDLAQMIREIMPGAGPAKENTQHTNRPVTIVTRSLISQLNIRGSSPNVDFEPNVAVSPDLIAGEDSSAQTRALQFDDLPPELRAQDPRRSQAAISMSAPTPAVVKPSMPTMMPPTPPTNVVLSPPVYALTPDMLPAPELSSVHGGTIGNTNPGVVVEGPARNYKWGFGVLAIAAIAGVTTAIMTQVGPSDPPKPKPTEQELTAAWEEWLKPIGEIVLPRVTVPPPAPPTVPTVPPPTQPVAAAGSAGSADATGSAGSAAVAAGVGSAGSGDTAKPGDRPRRNGLGHVVAQASHSAPTGDAVLRVETDKFAIITIDGQKQESPGAVFHLTPGVHTVHVTDKDGDHRFHCKVHVDSGRTSSLSPMVDDESCGDTDD